MSVYKTVYTNIYVYILMLVMFDLCAHRFHPRDEDMEQTAINVCGNGKKVKPKRNRHGMAWHGMA